jgi:iron complex outermembrane recepter protein
MATRAGIFLIIAATVFGQSRPDDLTQASLEQLMNIEVTSVSKKEQPLSKTPAAAFVITAEDIRRSGLSSLPEVLRLAPGVQVARSESGTWAVSIRGFNDDFSNKLLVLIDGRSVYNDVYGGTMWQMEMVPLEEIERIEVIRGPVAAMWGGNAINGVINVITRPASETQGGMVKAEAGTQSETTNGLRYGGAIGDAFYRVSAQYGQQAPFREMSGAPDTIHGFSNASVNFRLDWKAAPADSVTIEGVAYADSLGHPVIDPTPSNPFPAEVDAKEQSTNWSTMGRWRHTVSETSNFELEVTTEDTHSGDANVPVSFFRTDLDFRHRMELGKETISCGDSLIGGRSMS